MKKKRILILGAAGRDFHNFNVYFRDNEEYEVVAFTATQIPGIDDKKYPPSLAGKLYPQGIDILPEEDIAEIIEERQVDEVVMAYSDLPYGFVMSKASVSNALGPDFRLMGMDSTALKSKKPVISVCAVRTGCGKSQTTRRIVRILREKGVKVVVIRHPMPYGDLEKQRVQRFASYDDLDKHECTIEEREEYEPHVDMGAVVYAGVDYGDILEEAEKEADVILWDGGNNDIPFYVPDVNIVIVDPHRPGHELKYYPGETNLRMADIVIINKEGTADEKNIKTVEENIRFANPKAAIIHADSPISVDHEELIKGKRVLVIEDGPTLTHGGMEFGSGMVAAKKFGASEIVDPRPFAVGSIKDTFQHYSHLEMVLPAMGYGDRQLGELEETINSIDCDAVVSGTPIDITRVVNVEKPICRVKYELEEKGTGLEEAINKFITEIGKG